MIEFIIGTFLYAKFIKKMRINQLFKHWTIYFPMFFALVYIILEIFIWFKYYDILIYSKNFKTLTLLSYIPLIIKYKLYNSLFNQLRISKNEIIKIITSPMVLGGISIALGSLLNLKVVSENNGRMPVYPSLTYATKYASEIIFDDGIHILGTATSNFIPLSDIWDFGYMIASPGDILIRLYVGIILYYSIKMSQ